jgi:hypothetical protein
VPGSSDPICHLKYDDLESQVVAQLQQLVHPGESGANDYRIKVLGGMKWR